MKWLEASGIIHYSEANRVAVEIDPEIANFYRSLIPKYLPHQKPRWAPHITVVREEKETVSDRTYWGKREGEEIPFIYCNRIYQGKIYFWLDVLSKDLEEIRLELGLPCFHPFPEEKPVPEGYRKYFHCTIANCK